MRTAAHSVFFVFLACPLFMGLPAAAQEPAAAPQTPAPEAPQAAQASLPPPPTRPTAPATPLPSRRVATTVGHGELLQFTDVVDKLSVSEPAVADAVVVSPYEVVINAKAPGNTTLLVWHGPGVSRFDVTVQPDLAEVQETLRANLPGEDIKVTSSKDAILLSGVVSDAEAVKRAGAIASMFAKTVVNLLQAPTPENRQVMLQVKIATIDRVALSQFGVNLFSTSKKLIGTETTQQFPFPRVGQLQFQKGEEGQQQLGNVQVSMSDLLNIFAFRPDLNFGATLRMLQEKNLLEILAEPNLITVSGKEASFLAGGEFPIPVISSTGAGGSAAPVVTIQFRKFGVQLTFTPTVDPVTNIIHLKVTPEVSALDFSNALTMQGFLIPAISKRTADTEVDLREGESFAIAGLIDNRVTEVLSKVPGLGDVPILGKLFRSRSLHKSNTELLVVVTPRFVKPFAAGETPPSLQFPKEFLGGSKAEPVPPAPKFQGPRGQEPSGPPEGGKP